MSWYKNMPYEALEGLYLQNLRYYSDIIDYGTPTNYDFCRYCYFSILLTQLRNAARVSEAAEAIVRYYYTNEKIQYVKTRKQRRHEERIIVIPKEVCRDKLIYVRKLYEDGILHTDRVCSWVKVFWKRNKWKETNTHTNRHACITHLAKNNTNPLDIRAITKHKKLETILRYIHDSNAESILKRLNGEKDDR